MALVQSKGLPVGTSAPDFSLPGVDGETWSLERFEEAKALVVVFTCNHCPYAQATEDRLVAIQREYRDKGVRLVAINPNDSVAYPDDNFDAMRVRAEERGFNFPYLQDETQEVAKAYDAVCTPDPYVFDRERRLTYAGRVDDNWKEEDLVTSQDLRKAIEATLEGKELDFVPIPSMGCSIKWKK